MRKDLLAGYLAGLTAAAIWGGMYVVSKVVMEVIPPFALLSSRLLLGIATLLLVAIFIPAKNRSLNDIRNYFFVGVVGYGISLGFQFLGTKLSTASNGSLVTSSTPALVLPFAYLLLREKITRFKIAAILLASLGVLAIIDLRSIDLSSNLFLGNLSLTAAAITWALYSVLVRKFTKSNDIIFATAVMLAGGLPIALPMGVWEYINQGFGVINVAVILGILFLGIISTALAMFLWNFAFTQISAAQASLTFFAQPLVGTFLGWFFLHETITPLVLVGGGLICIGIYLSSIPDQSASPNV